MTFTAAVLTISDKGSKGLRTDTSGPALVSILKNNNYDVLYTNIIPDEKQIIESELINLSDRMQMDLVLTTGGTGFSPRDITPEATKAVIEREAPGLAELMRMESLKITPKAALSRSVCGIRKKTLIINLPGSEKGARENFQAVVDVLPHGIEILKGQGSADCGAQTGIIKAVCISQKKGTVKVPVGRIELKVDVGITGDAHSGNWHRQVSLLSTESVAKAQQRIDFKLDPGVFAENILVEGICLYKIPVGTKIKIGTAVCQVTQIGKECHSDCAIRKQTGDCVMPREGIFAKVLQDGVAMAGNTVTVL